VLIIGVFALTDASRDPLEPAWLGFMVGQLVLAIGLSLGWSTGYAINPARDFGPRVLSACAGWGSEVFTAHNYYFVVPLVAPLLGAGLGTLVYKHMAAPPVTFNDLGEPPIRHRRLSMEATEILAHRRRYTSASSSHDEAMTILLRDSPTDGIN
jgi:hypothetical protein